MVMSIRRHVWIETGFMNLSYIAYVICREKPAFTSFEDDT